MKLSIPKLKIKKQQNKGLECLNCGQPFIGSENFCSNCGQKNTTKKLNLGTFFNNLFAGFLSYDSRFWRTFIPLLTKPGKVSKDYISGKRVRFVNPFQLYLNVSIVFFLILGISNRIDSNNSPITGVLNTTQNLDSLAKTSSKQLDSVLTSVNQEIIKNNPKDSIKKEEIENLKNILNKVENTPIVNTNFDSISNSDKLGRFYKYQKNNPNLPLSQALDSLGYEKTFWNTFYYQQIINVNSNYEQFKKDGGQSYFKKLTSYISISLFVFLPIFTFFLMLLYFRRKYTYIEHLVFVFHTQTVFFLLLIIFYLIGFVVELEYTGFIFTLLFLLYLYKALRNFYNQGRIKTIIKYIIMNSFYLFLAFFGLLIAAGLSIISN